jgi:hypothetical protein
MKKNIGDVKWGKWAKNQFPKASLLSAGLELTTW